MTFFATGPAHVEVHWCATEAQSKADMERARAALDAEEQARAERFVFDEDRRGYVVAHGLLRLVLGAALGRSPRELAFRHTERGRPELEAPGPTPIRFNLTHTRGMVGCAVTRGRDIGFDLELVRRPAPLEIAQRYFCPSELEWLAAQETEQHDDAFYVLWTLKEAYMKARGLGLALALSSFAALPRFHAAADGFAELTLRPLDDPGPWALRSFQHGEHRAALAVRGEPAELELSLFADRRLASL